jgi:hypothetical protein
MIAEIMDRLSEEVDGLNHVGNVLGFAHLSGNPPPHRLPAAYVVDPGKTSEPSERLTGHTRQRVTRRVSLLVAIGNIADPEGRAAAVALETLEVAIEAALRGYTLDAGSTPIVHERTVLLEAAEGVVWRQMDFSYQSWDTATEVAA